MNQNVYFPYQIPYSQSSLDQIFYNQIILHQLYQAREINNLNFMQNYSFENHMVSKENACPSTEFFLKQQKLVSPIGFPSEQIGSIQEKNNQENTDQTRNRQKYGRNITSNIFRSLLKRISSQNRFKKLSVKIIQQKKFQMTYQNFIEQINRLSFKLKSYVKKNEMRRFIVADPNNRKSKEFCMLFRILGKIYLKEEHTTSIFYSKKISKQSRGLHFTIAREMEDLLK